MTFKSLLLAGVLAGAAICASASAADLPNAGFETGDLTGWTYDAGFVEVVTEADDAVASPPFGQHYLPVEGGYFARLTAGVDLGVYTTLSRSFSLLTASVLSGDAAFLAFDYLPDYDDDAYVRVRKAGSDQVLFASSIGAVGDYGHTDWTHFTSGTLSSGSYVLEAGVRDNGDFGGSSQLLVDNFALTAVAVGGVPEPAMWSLMILGFTGVGGMLRGRRRAPSIV
jgi:hypothetical protein